MFAAATGEQCDNHKRSLACQAASFVRNKFRLQSELSLQLRLFYLSTCTLLDLQRSLRRSLRKLATERICIRNNAKLDNCKRKLGARASFALGWRKARSFSSRQKIFSSLRFEFRVFGSSLLAVSRRVQRKFTQNNAKFKRNARTKQFALEFKFNLACAGNIQFGEQSSARCVTRRALFASARHDFSRLASDFRRAKELPAIYFAVD